MKLDQCISCHGTELHQVSMTSGMWAVGLKGGSFESAAPVKCSVCLSCGFIAPYVDEMTTRTVRLWKKAAERKAERKRKDGGK